MDSKKLLSSVICLLIFTTYLQVQAKSTGNRDFEEYLRAMNSSTTTPNVEERMPGDSYILAFLNYSYTNSDGKVVEYSEENARYGEGKVLNVTGLLVHVSARDAMQNDDACSENILGTQGNPFPADPWIALVRRGHCNFEDKVKHVANQGAIGVIIYNDKPVINLEKMQIKDKNRNITAVITFLEVGRDMADILDQGYNVIASISKGRSGVRPINTLNRTSVLFVSISFIVLMIISLVWLIFYYVQRFRYLQSKDQQSRHLCSVTKRAIMKIPTKTGKSNDKDGDSDCCAICIEAYKSSDCIRVLPCNHEFHKVCIDPWLIEHRTCPMCKLDVLKFYGYVVGEPSASLSPPNERIISANDHMIITPSNMHNSHIGNSNNSSNISSSRSDSTSSNSNNNGINTVNLIMISRTVPTTTDATPESDTRLNANNTTDRGNAIITTSTSSRQVTDV